MTAKRFVLALILAGAIAIPAAVLRAQSSESIALRVSDDLFDDIDRLLKKAEGQRLEGSWVVTVTPVVPPGVPQPPPFRVYATIARGGAFIGTDTRRPLNIQHGAWTHLDDNDFAWTFVEDFVDAMGNSIALKVRVKLTVTGANEFVGVGNAEERNAATGVVVNRCATLRGSRITVEPLARECQSIVPPR